MKETKHSPTPWCERGYPFEGVIGRWIDDRNFQKIAHMEGPSGRQNSVFIIRAVNAYEDLLNAAVLALAQIEADEFTHGRAFSAGEALRSAIAKAEEP